MTAPDDTNSESDNSVLSGTDEPLGSNPDAQLVVEYLQRCDGRNELRQRLKFHTQLPDAVLDDALVALEDAGVVTITAGYGGDRIELIPAAVERDHE
jgi:hypothetical protein